jgi:putative lipoic acid-binding regulatory protein
MSDEAPAGGDADAGKKARFEDLLDYPNAFTFRVVCAALPRAESDTTECLERLTGQSATIVSTQASRTGKWTVFRIQVEVATADQIRTAYTVLNELDCVRMVL